MGAELHEVDPSIIVLVRAIKGRLPELVRVQHRIVAVAQDPLYVILLQVAIAVSVQSIKGGSEIYVWE